ncbi:MAG TPA: hypothetical protein GXZ48_02890 [Acholeplasmataceae bacterium]|jgi:hypothetical protein|nr:hypothetical protein [Acholeplasmataceae bacterium]
MHVIKKLIKLIIIIVSLFAVFMVNGLIESRVVNKELEEFKARGELVYENENNIYYRVKPKYDYEDTSRHIMNDYFDWQIGATGDIFVTSRNPLQGNPITGFISDHTWVGHTGLVIDDEGQNTIEITGNLDDRDRNVVDIWYNDWVIDRTTDQIVLLRVKNTTEDDRNKMVEYAKSQLGKPYNYTFLFNRAYSFYCSDLVSRSVANAGINVNYDYLATTGSDMIVSPNTYIIYYREKIGENKFAVYYLSGDE